MVLFQRRRSPLDDLDEYLRQPQSSPQQAAQSLSGPPAQPPLTYSRPSQNRAAERSLTSAAPPPGRAVTIEIDGIGRVQMGPEFSQLSDEQQQAAVEEIASSFGGPQEPQGYDASLVAQGLSGVNEGIAGTLGLPVDLATSALNLVPAGIDAVAGTNLGRLNPDDQILGSEWLRARGRDIGAIRPESNDPTAQFARRTMQSVGAAVVPVAGAGGTVGQMARGMIPAIGGGAAAATAREVFPGNPVAEIGAELVGTGLTGAGMYGLARRQAGRAARAAVPTTDQLRQQASDLYAQAESRGVVAGPDVTNRLAEQVRGIAQREALITPTGRVSTAYPRAAEAMNLMDDYAGHDLNPTQMQVIRETLADAVGGTTGRERRISRMMLNAFDRATAPLAPELAQARSVASRYLQADRIAAARETARANTSTFTGSGSENALRTQFRQLDRRVIRDQERFHPDVDQAIREVNRGTTASNAARNIGKLAPTSVVGGGLSGTLPFLAGNALGGPALGATFAAGSWGAGTAGRALATRQTENAAAMAELIARNGGRLNVNPPSMDVQRLTASLMGQTGPQLNQQLPQFMRGMNDDYVRQMAASEPGQPEYEDEESRRRRLLGLPGY